MGQRLWHCSLLGVSGWFSVMLWVAHSVLGNAVLCLGPVGGDRAFCILIQTTLCNTSLDNPTQRNKDQLIRAAVKFLDTDTIW